MWLGQAAQTEQEQAVPHTTPRPVTSCRLNLQLTLRSTRSSQLLPHWFLNQVAQPLHESNLCWHGCGPGCSLSRPLPLQSSLSSTQSTPDIVSAPPQGTVAPNIKRFLVMPRSTAAWRLARAPSQLHTHSAANCWCQHCLGSGLLPLHLTQGSSCSIFRCTA
jgi:hypothetical protein